MKPIEFIKSCFIIAWVIISFAVYVKVSFTFVDWIVAKIRKAILKRRIKRVLMKFAESTREALEKRESLEELDDLTERVKVERK